MQTNRCEGVGGIDAGALEDFILSEMKELVKQFETLTRPENRPEKPKIQEINVKIEQIMSEINKLLDKVADADGTLMDYINGRVKELDAKANAYRQEHRQCSHKGIDNKSEINEG